MSGRDAIELIVERESENAESALKEFAGIERLAEALLAEAALPKRRPEWVAWARKRAKTLGRIAKQLKDLLYEMPP